MQFLSSFQPVTTLAPVIFGCTGPFQPDQKKEEVQKRIRFLHIT